MFCKLTVFREAISLHDKTLNLRIAKLSPAHPDTLDSIGHLSLAYLIAKMPKKALPLVEKFLTGRRKKDGRDALGFSDLPAVFSTVLLKHSQHFTAEKYLRECMIIRKKVMPDHWLLFNTKSMFGEALAGQKKFTEAEPLLLEGYEGMKQREDKIPSTARVRLTEAIQRLVDLYTIWNKPDKAAEWQKKLDAEKTKLQKQKRKSKPMDQPGIQKKKSDASRDKPLIAPRPKLVVPKIKE